MTFYELEVARDYALTKAADLRVGTPESNEAWKEFERLDDEYQKLKQKITGEIKLKRRARVS